MQHVDTDVLRFPLLELAVICYARPFSTNRGLVHRRHSLAEDVVPQEHRALHQELIRLRDKAFAHTDHEFRNPQVSRWPTDTGKGSYIMGFANPDYSALVRRVPEIEALAMTVEAVLHARIAAVHDRFDEMMNGPAPNEEL